MKRTSNKGFTIIESMVVVAIVVILSALAAPNLSQLLAAKRTEDVARRLGEDMAFGRNEAVKRNTPVLLCANASGACAATPTAAIWAQGWRVCYDANADGACDASADTDPNPMRVQAALTNIRSFTGPQSRVRFNPDGSLSATDLTAFTVTGSGTAAVRWLVRIAASGAVTVRKG